MISLLAAGAILAAGAVNAQCGDNLDSAEATAFAATLQSTYPRPLTIAKIVRGDTEAQKTWEAIQANSSYTDALAIAPKSATTVNPPGDPDCWWTFGGCVEPKKDYLPKDHHNCAQSGTWGLTFDDGPTCASHLLYPILRKEKLKASLYFVGGNVLSFPGQAQAAVEEGHEICSHTWSHHETTYLSNEEVFAELYYTTKAIKDITGIQSTCFRPSYGDIDDRVRTIAHALGLRIDLWSDDTFDWEIKIKGKRVIDANYNAIIAKASAAQGVTVLTHETSPDTVGQFENRFPLVKNAFQHFVPVGVCENIAHPYVQQNITFPSYASYISGDIEPQPAITAFMSNTPLVLTNLGQKNPTAADPTTSSSSPRPSDTARTGGNNNASNAGQSQNDSQPQEQSGAMRVKAAGAVVVAAVFAWLL